MSISLLHGTKFRLGYRNMDFFEQAIYNYSGKSSEIKPTIATGADMRNGSRWREVDTGKVYYYNIADDTWYEAGPYNITIAGATPTIDMRTLSVMEQILTTLKKIEYHLYLGTDTELKDQDV